MVSTMTAPKNVKNKPAVDETLVSATVSGDTPNVPVALPTMQAPPLIYTADGDIDTEATIAAQKAFIESLTQIAEGKKAAKRAVLIEQVTAKEAVLNPLIIQRDIAKQEYDRLSSACAVIQEEIKEIHRDPVFPQVKPNVARGKGQDSPDGPRDRNGVLFALLPDGTVKVDSKGRRLVDERSKRHIAPDGSALSHQYDGQALLMGV